jgi:hypothetical protein
MKTLLNSPLTKSVSAVGNTTCSTPVPFVIQYKVSLSGCEDFVNGLLSVLIRQPCFCTARGFWDTGLKPTLPEHAVEAAAGDIQPG